MRSMRVALAGMLLGVCALTSSAGVVRPKSNAAQQQQISRQLDQFQITTADLRTNADTYQALARNRSLPIRTHANNLNRIRDQVNDLGRQLLAMEKVKARANEHQQLAITEARQRLSELTPHLYTAIRMHIDTPATLEFPDYREEVKSIFTHADNLYTRVHAVRTYDKAKQNLDQIMSPGL
jgi:gas vesicle protein